MSSPRLLITLFVSLLAVSLVSAQVLSIPVQTAQWTLQQAAASILKVAANPAAAIKCAGDQIKQIASSLTTLANDIVAFASTLSPSTLSTIPSFIGSEVAQFQANTVSNTTCLSVSDQQAVTYYQGQANAEIAALQTAVAVLLG